MLFNRNPNFPPRQKFLTVNTRDRFEPSYVQWPAYDRHSQKYLNIGKFLKLNHTFKKELDVSFSENVVYNYN